MEHVNDAYRFAFTDSDCVISRHETTCDFKSVEIYECIENSFPMPGSYLWIYRNDGLAISPIECETLIKYVWYYVEELSSEDMPETGIDAELLLSKKCLMFYWNGSSTKCITDKCAKSIKAELDTRIKNNRVADPAKSKYYKQRDKLITNILVRFSPARNN